MTRRRIIIALAAFLAVVAVAFAARALTTPAAAPARVVVTMPNGELVDVTDAAPLRRDP